MPYTNEQIVQLLEKSDAAVHRALVVLLDQQTAEEQRSHTTKEHNGRGFNAYDAKDMTEIARRVRGGAALSRNLLPKMRARVKKYAGQLARIANAREATRDIEVQMGVREREREQVNFVSRGGW